MGAPGAIQARQTHNGPARTQIHALKMASRKRRSSSSVRSPISTSSSGGRGRAASSTSSLPRSRVVPTGTRPMRPASDTAAPPPTNQATRSEQPGQMSRRSGPALSAGTPGEPTVGATTVRFTSTDPDSAGSLPQVSGSTLDSPRPGQTLDSCLGVKGSPVQIRPSRPKGPGQKGFRVYLGPLTASGPLAQGPVGGV